MGDGGRTLVGVRGSVCYEVGAGHLGGRAGPKYAGSLDMRKGGLRVELQWRTWSREGRGGEWSDGWTGVDTCETSPPNRAPETLDDAVR